MRDYYVSGFNILEVLYDLTNSATAVGSKDALNVLCDKSQRFLGIHKTKEAFV